MIVVCPRCSAANRLDAGRTHDEPVCGKCGTALLDGKPIAIDDARFERFVTRNELPVVVDFWAAWCGPCRAMAPQFERAARELKGRARLVKVNTEEAAGLASRMGIRAIPTIALFRDGAEVKRVSGALDAGSLVRWAQL